MAFTTFRDMKPFSQLMFSIFVILVCTLVFMVVAIILAIFIFGMNSILNLSNLNDFSNPESLKVLKYFQVIQGIGLFIVPPFILAYLYHGKIYEYLYLNKSFESSSVLLVLLVMFFAAPFINFVGELNSNMHFPEWLSGVEEWMKDAEEKAAIITEAFLKVDTLGGLLFNIFMIAIIPAIGEELLFRGVIQRIFTRWTRNNHWGIWIAAILFSALHMQFYGFVPRMLLGVLFGYLLVWSGSMWLPIIAHFLNNAFAVIAMYMIDKDLISPKVEEFGSTTGSYYGAVISIIMVGVFLFMIKKQNTMNQLKN